MNPTSRPSRESTSVRGHAVLLSRGVPALLLALALVLAVGCASGYVTTSTGAIVPASVVQSQDITGDALSVLQDVHNAAVMAHDAKAGAEPAEVHAKRREILKASAAGLRAAWDGLAAWKLGSEGAGMASVVGKLRDALPELLDAAVSLGVVSREYADVIGAFFGTAAQGIAPKPLEKKPVASVAVLEPAPYGIEMVQVPAFDARSIVQAPGRALGPPSLSGCTPEDIARGICVGGCTASIPPVCSYWRIGGASTLEMTPRPWASIAPSPLGGSR